MAETRTFDASGIDQREMARKVSSWLKLHDFEAQIVDLPDGRITVQARQPKSWRYILGMSSALNVTFDIRGNNLVVETEAGSWAEKVAVGAVGVFILHPLLITMAYGIWKQSQLPEKVFEVVEQHVSEKRGPSEGMHVPVQSSGESATDLVTPDPASAKTAGAEDVSPAASKETVCSSCGQAAAADAKYCPECGAGLKSRSVEIE